MRVGVVFRIPNDAQPLNLVTINGFVYPASISLFVSQHFDTCQSHAKILKLIVTYYCKLMGSTMKNAGSAQKFWVGRGMRVALHGSS